VCLVTQVPKRTYKYLQESVDEERVMLIIQSYSCGSTLRTNAKDFLIRKCTSTATQSKQATGVGDLEAPPKKQINHGLIEDPGRRRPRDSS
jgi:hypothetical protein